MTGTGKSAAAIAIGLWLAAPATAGDTARLAILGFSADASVFAFEEFGVQDGSGFAYANRFYIDVAGDSFIPGTPFRVLLQDEGATEQQARQQARDQGQAIVSDDELAANAGWLAGYNAVTELSADPLQMTVNPRPVVPPVDETLEFRLEEFDVEAPERCRDFGPTKGFRLLRVDLAPGGAVSLLHEDDTVPQSRGCPLGYRLGAVQTVHPDGGPASYAVMISVRSFGFEGPDHRWIAVTGRL